jgi:putative FmdB family regulatory protein
MPIYAYHCRDCGEEFETLVLSDEVPACEACASEDLDQRLSLIASPAKGGESSAEACDAPGGCACAAMRAGMADA